MDATNIIARLRDAQRGGFMDHVTAAKLRNLEIELAGTEQEDFTCDIMGYDTVLSYLAKTNPEALELMVNPVHETISVGIDLSKRLHSRGVPIIKVAACEHMKRRFPKARYVNAYPTNELAAYFA
ncbi:hypothetical protein [Shimia sp.]|uniref:hypothetical protein n=1 Tax=Shimia sp. TaxID=1954381 RepID=UPI003BAC6FFD